jgi:glucosamine--fructose-6-phosphate aminotransferase (isomerizing)
MCGMVGGVAARDVVPVLMQGLRRMEYLGYDSCGIAVHENDGLHRARCVGRVAGLQAQISSTGFSGRSGIAHTRWASRGEVITRSAHPHFSADRAGSRRIAVVHNGVIENFEAVRSELQAFGYLFKSETDTQAIAHLLTHLYDGDLLSTVRKAVKRLRGVYAIAVMCHDEPARVVGARCGTALVLGLGLNVGLNDGTRTTGNFLASDPLALSGPPNQLMRLHDGDLVDLHESSVQVYDAHGLPVRR